MFVDYAFVKKICCGICTIRSPNVFDTQIVDNQWKHHACLLMASPPIIDGSLSNTFSDLCVKFGILINYNIFQ